jgi:hypothetical protein
MHAATASFESIPQSQQTLDEVDGRRTHNLYTGGNQIYQIQIHTSPIPKLWSGGADRIYRYGMTLFLHPVNEPERPFIAHLVYRWKEERDYGYTHVMIP